MTQDPWDESAGALVHHAVELKRGVNIKDHLHRAKMRIVKLEILFKEDVPKKDLPQAMKVIDGFMHVYNQYPFSDNYISGTKFADQVKLLIGRPKTHTDSILKKGRELRNGEHEPFYPKISWENADSPKKSLYQKKDRRVVPRQPKEFVQETINFEE